MDAASVVVAAVDDRVAFGVAIVDVDIDAVFIADEVVDGLEVNVLVVADVVVGVVDEDIASVVCSGIGVGVVITRTNEYNKSSF